MPEIGRCWSLCAEQPVCVVQPGYQNRYIYSAVCPESGEDFTLILPAVNTEMMNLYLHHLAKAYPDRRLLLLMDQAGWHRSGDLCVPKNIKLDYLPAYSPELNPVERLWRWLRDEVCRNRLYQTMTELLDALVAGYDLLKPQKFSTICRCSYL
jgi:transposase